MPCTPRGTVDNGHNIIALYCTVINKSPLLFIYYINITEPRDSEWLCSLSSCRIDHPGESGPPPWGAGNHRSPSHHGTLCWRQITLWSLSKQWSRTANQSSRKLNRCQYITPAAREEARETGRIREASTSKKRGYVRVPGLGNVVCAHLPSPVPSTSK